MSIIPIAVLTYLHTKHLWSKWRELGRKDLLHLNCIQQAHPLVLCSANSGHVLCFPSISDLNQKYRSDVFYWETMLSDLPSPACIHSWKGTHSCFQLKVASNGRNVCLPHSLQESRCVRLSKKSQLVPNTVMQLLIGFCCPLPKLRHMFVCLFACLEWNKTLYN